MTPVQLNHNSTFTEGVCTKRALSDAYRAFKRQATAKGHKTTRRELKARARAFPYFHTY